MTGLETAAIIVAIVFMGIIIITFLVILGLVLGLTVKITRLIRSIEEKVDQVKDIPILGKRLFRAAKKKW